VKAFGDNWFRLQPNFRIATSTFHMDMRRFAWRPFIGEEEIAEAAIAKDDRHVDLFSIQG